MAVGPRVEGGSRYVHTRFEAELYNFDASVCVSVFMGQIVVVDDSLGLVRKVELD